MSTPDPVVRARAIRNQFVAAAMVTGAVPVPGASVAVSAESAACATAILAHMGTAVSADVVIALAATYGVHSGFRTMFVEGARLLAWGAGPLGLAPVCALGATTAGLQVFVLAELTIAYALNGGLDRATARATAADATQAFWHQFHQGGFRAPGEA